MTNNETEIKTCFIVTPIGNESTEVRRAAEGIIDAVIIPVLTELNIKVEVAHRISETGSINKQIITRLVGADLVVANLTGLNPNVMYELAIRHAVQKPVIQLMENGTKLPFDVTEERTLIYKNDMYGVVSLQKDFRAAVKHALANQEIDNPIVRAIKSDVLLNNIKENAPEKYETFKRIEEMEEKFIGLFNKLGVSTNDVHYVSKRVTHHFYADINIEINDFVVLMLKELVPGYDIKIRKNPDKDLFEADYLMLFEIERERAGDVDLSKDYVHNELRNQAKSGTISRLDTLPF
ncbi:hypothetical protein [Terribacillus saccharophilus]|uniref:hypothetical protein n=1 Tax=Terribacillus saccharophilus TaxID=361277 RepID=UPI002DC9EFAF|nr:hypothetical protein [Terribacillus saccharophilus]MEC0288929.1 hypothetical protein [Terribacillus saccharophilus]